MSNNIIGFVSSYCLSKVLCPIFVQLILITIFSLILYFSEVLFFVFISVIFFLIFLYNYIFEWILLKTIFLNIWLFFYCFILYCLLSQERLYNMYFLYNTFIFILALLVFIVLIYVRKEYSRYRIRTYFSKYVSKDVVNKILVVKEDELQLWWKKRYLTIFFSDLVWFTDLSEKLKPEDLLKILWIYFEKMSSAILYRQWTIDKFMWDAIMAFWNAPLETNNHEDLACEAALLQRMVLENVRDAVKKLWVESEIDMRIWINSWESVVWNFWCSKRYDYTILWDPVNLASRLEWINKQYWTRIIIWENTYNNIKKDRFITREIDMITVKWKIQPVRIYELMSFNYWNNYELYWQIKLYEKALSLYRDWKFTSAMEMFKKVWDSPSKVFITRCEQFIKDWTDDSWDWIYRFKVK